MKIAPNGKTIDSCVKCEMRRHKAGPVGWVCTELDDRQTGDTEGFPSWCPLNDATQPVEKDELAQLADLVKRRIIDQSVYDNAVKKMEQDKLPPLPWKPVYVDQEKAYLLDNDGNMIFLYTHDDKYVEDVMPLFENATQMLDILKALTAWHEYDQLNTAKLSGIVTDAEVIIRKAEGEDE